MNLKNHLIVLVLLFTAAYLSLSNPSEKTYLSRVSDDYKKYHLEMDIPVEVLQQVGMSERSTYLLFSTYQYQYGGISVHYVGVANSIYYVGIRRMKKKNQPLKMV